MAEFLTNYTPESFLDRLRKNLAICETFNFSVSFIKRPGLRLIYTAIEDALKRGAKGRIITSTYQRFTDVESLLCFEKLSERYPDFSCHLDYDNLLDQVGYFVLGFHSKGYLFSFADGTVETVVGSSNLTFRALTQNIEWDLVSRSPSAYREAMSEFEDKWNRTQPLSEESIESYRRECESRMMFAVGEWDLDFLDDNQRVAPNSMQVNALKELERLRMLGQSRALVVSAAGSGKTVLAALDAFRVHPSKLLYIAHDSSILVRAQQTFEKVFGPQIRMGIYNGEQKRMDADFLFSTNLTMANSLEFYDREEFDYIIIDECHHAAAATYRAIIEYFRPEFLLGITATPDRTDNADIYELFGNNLPYNLRLGEAIRSGLIVPFHYYGIRDQLISYDLTSSRASAVWKEIASQANCDFIHEEIQKHRRPGEPLKAIGFCSNKLQAETMAREMQRYGYVTSYLTDRNRMRERQKAFDDFQSDQSADRILFAVNVLNEGVDLPKVNMVLFLRPTESSIVFIQQLGRGLRHSEGKEYLTVLDFIGNDYRRCTQIAIALGSLGPNLVLEKKLLKDMVTSNFDVLDLSASGVEIHIDALSRQEILDYLDRENFNQLRFLQQDYENYKNYLRMESYPAHTDYLNNDFAPDLLRFISAKKSYYRFLEYCGENTRPALNEQELHLVDDLSQRLPIVRHEEFSIVKELLEGAASLEDLRARLDHCSEKPLQHAVKFLIKDGLVLSREEDGQQLLKLNATLSSSAKDFIRDLLEYGLNRFIQDYGVYDDYKLHADYRSKQILQILLRDPDSNQYGTYYDHGNVYILATLKKDLEDGNLRNYADRFLSRRVFQWESTHDIRPGDRQRLESCQKAFLFIRKFERQSGGTLPYTFVGAGRMTNLREEPSRRSLLFDIELENELPEHLCMDWLVPKEKS